MTSAALPNSGANGVANPVGEPTTEAASRAADLIAELAGVGVRLWTDGGKLRYRAPAGVLTPDRLAELAAHKSEVLAHLSSAGGDGELEIQPDPENRYEPFPLTDVQAAYLLGRTDAYALGAVGCHGYLELAVTDLDPIRLSAAWNRLIRRHDMLRAIVHPDGYQQVLAEVPEVNVPVADLRGVPAAQVPARVEEIRAELAHRVYRTDRWPLFELRATRTDDGDLVHFSIDLLIADYVSVTNLLAELDQLYRRPETALPELALTFRDYLAAERADRDRGAGGRYEADRAYWFDRVDELPLAPRIPTADQVLNPGEAAESIGSTEDSRADGTTAAAPRFVRHQLTLDSRRWTAFTEHARKAGLTPSVAVLAAYAEIIGRWSETDQFSLNLTLLNRRPVHPEVGQVVGDFTATSLLAIDQRITEQQRDGASDFVGRARAIGDQLMADLDHRGCSGVEVLREMARRRGRDAAMMPIVFTSTLGAATQPESANAGNTVNADGGLLTAPPVSGLSQTPQVTVDCQAFERDGALSINWDVRADVFPDGLIEDAFATFERTLESLADNPSWDRPAPIETPDRHARIIAETNATAAPPPDALLHEAIIAQALRAGNRTAVIDSDGTTSFGDLFARATAIANALDADEADRLVGVGIRKSAEQIAAVLGILLSGRAYLPIDPDLPYHRRALLAADAGISHVLIATKSAESVAWPADVRQIAVDTLPVQEPPTAAPARRAKPDELAYVIYTSGSTGVPKGVMMSHRAALNTIDDINRRYEIGYGDRVLGLANLSFDLSVYDIFGPLAAGGALVLPSPDRRGDPAHWAELVAQHAVTIWNSVPAQLRMLEHYLASTPAVELFTLRLALLSGDWIPVDQPDSIRARIPYLEMIGLGGATEAGIWSIHHPIDRVPENWRSIPYGKPLTNQSWQVLDANLRPCPEWVAGDLYIGGIGLAQGYLGDADRTAASFLTWPATGERLYRTGDRGRRLPDGSIEFLGRIDNQVKVRGHRIELAEIETALTAHPAISAAVAIVDGDDPLRRRLAAFAEIAHQPTETQPERSAVTAAAGEAAKTSTLDVAGMAEFVAFADRVALIAMAATLREAGLFATDDRVSASEVVAALAAAPRHHRLVRRWLSALVTDGLLTADPDGRFGDLVKADREILANQLAELARMAERFDFGAELVSYLTACGASLPGLLRDEVDARELLFPGSSVDTARVAFRDNPVNRHLNDVLAAGVQAIAAARSSNDGPLRVLEIGAGVGGSSAAVIAALDGNDVDYLFTDVSRFFLAEAEEVYADRPWVRFGHYDLNVDPRAQGLAPNSFDVIIAGNALHLAKNAPEALRTTRELLAPGGWLAFIEGTAENLPLLVSMEFTSELTGFTDSRQTYDQTLLSREAWTEFLSDIGADIAWCSAPTEGGRSLLGQHVFLAQANTDRVPVRPADLATHLADRLPAHMVPAHLELLDALPVTGNGKVDRDTLAGWLPREESDSRPEPAAEGADELERHLIELWREVLGHQNLGRDEDFFSVGGDSLLLARLVGQMIEHEPAAAGQDFGDLLGAVLRRPTVAAIAQYLRTTDSRAESGDSTDSTQDGSSTEKVEYSPLIDLNAEAADRSATPVVLVHEGTGSLAPYRALVERLKGDQPNIHLLGLEPGRTDTYRELAPETLIEQLATEHVQRLRDAGIERIRLVGYCMGGLIATAMAGILTEAGVQVDTVTVISSYRVPYEVEDDLIAEFSFARVLGADTAALGYPADDGTIGAAMGAVIGTHQCLPAGAIAGLSGEHAEVAAAFSRLAEREQADRLAAIVASMPAGQFPVDPGYLASMYDVFRHSLLAMARYRGEPFAGDITLLRDSGQVQLLPPMADEMTAYWERAGLGTFRVVDIPGDHFTCLSPNHVNDVVHALEGEWA